MFYGALDVAGGLGDKPPSEFEGSKPLAIFTGHVR